MSAQHALPMWLQWAWGLAGCLAFVGALVWVFAIFWPYIKWTRKVMKKSLDLGNETATLLRDFQHEAAPVLKDGREVVQEVKRLIEKHGLEKTLEAIREIPEKLDRLARKPDAAGEVEVPSSFWGESGPPTNIHRRDEP